MMTEAYEILSDGALFCVCQHTEDGDIKLITKNTSISFLELQKKVLNPQNALKDRGKRRPKKKR